MGRNRPIEGELPYVYLDSVALKQCGAAAVKNVSILVAIGVGTEGYRQILGIAKSAKEDQTGWSGFLAHLKPLNPYPLPSSLTTYPSHVIAG